MFYSYFDGKSNKYKSIKRHFIEKYLEKHADI